MGDSSVYTNFKVLLPICLSILVLLGLIAVVLLIRKRSKFDTWNVRQNIHTFFSLLDALELAHQSRLATSSMSDSPSLANLQNKQNRDQQYHAVRCQSNRNSNSNDSGSYKAEGNEYIEDICPYATFQLNKQTYSESSYSGNVYSGPYHSVRGSFVYHDVKPEGYQVYNIAC